MPQLIPPPELYPFLLWFAPCFTAPSLAHFVSFIVCFACGLGRMTATTVYRTSPHDSHWTNYSRFLSRYRWSVRALSARLLELLIARCGLWLDDQGRRLCVVIDETIVEKSSPRMPGVAWQRNTHGGWCAAHDFVAIVRGRIDAQVHDLYVPRPRRGRPRVWGDALSLA
ncbi:MAG: transposase, partial [Armatimonadetes bacterium]|nr:transposase [Armatimonadota bacterium]